MQEMLGMLGMLIVVQEVPNEVQWIINVIQDMQELQ